MQKIQKKFFDLQELPHSKRMPLLFIGHGNPMNAIEDNVFTKAWRALAKSIARPKVIIVMSAHWVTLGGNFVTAISKPQMIYDMYGFPEELYRKQYPAPGNVFLAKQINKEIAKIGLDNQWGFDHGTWSVLAQMYPEANIPVLQLSINNSITPLEEFYLLEQLKDLRDHGVLFIGSGNIVHNLGAINWNDQAHDWALEFDAIAASLIEKRDLKALIDYEKLGITAKLSIPTDEHYRPMLATLALANSQDNLKFFNEKVVMGSVGMRSFILE